MRPQRTPQALSLLLLSLVLADLLYSFWQHYQGTLDGDMARIILPSKLYSQVLKDPLGIKALVHNNYYVAPNRFMPHWSMERYYKLVPIALQRIATPLDSLYLATAIAKTIIQAILIYLSSAFISGTLRCTNRNFLQAAVLITPLFQTYGHNYQIGIIDTSITYTFFYALASAWLLWFLLPYFLHYFHHYQLPTSWWRLLAIIPLAWIITFNGPINSAVILLIGPVLLLYMAYHMYLDKLKSQGNWANVIRNTPRMLIWGILAALFFAALSFYISGFNLENIGPTLPLNERYTRLGIGIRKYFTDGPAPLLLPGAVLLNLVLINAFRLPNARRLNRLSLWFCLFAAIFIALLPLGGYRVYRPFIIRKDAIQPILLGIIILYGLTSVCLLTSLKGLKLASSASLLIVISFYFTGVDGPGSGLNHPERTALNLIAKTPGPIVEIQGDTYIMAWDKITDYNKSKDNAKLLYYWNVFPEIKYYYQK